MHSVDATVAQLLEQAGVELGKYDKVSPSKDTVLEYGQKIAITRAYDVKVTADGKTTTVKCLDNTVSELLKRAGVTLGKNDMVSEELETKITEPTEIKVSRVEIKTETQHKGCKRQDKNNYNDYLHRRRKDRCQEDNKGSYKEG